LLNIAKEIIKLNESHDAALSGSLFLQLLGIDLGRKNADIDIIVDKPIIELDLKIPEGWIQTQGKTINSVAYKNPLLNINLDILYSLENRQMIGLIKCGDIYNLINAKNKYIYNNSPSKEKHINDLKIINEWLNKVK
jgi:hypothetical protein